MDSFICRAHDVPRFTAASYAVTMVNRLRKSPECVRLRWGALDSSFDYQSDVYDDFYPSASLYRREPARGNAWPNIFLLASGALALGSVFYLGVKYYLYKRARDPIGNPWLSWYVSKLIGFTEQPRLEPATVRSTFNNALTVTKRNVDNHTHANSAAVRNASVQQIELIASSLGRKPYFVQQSTNDVKRSREGCRSYYWAKDLGVDSSAFNPKPDEVVAIIDVDMYIDMPSMLANHVHTYMISTFQPGSVAETNQDFSFTFDGDSVVRYTISGGAEFVHKVWNYKSDVLWCVSELFLGLAYRCTAYNIDRRQTDDHHQIILLTPMRTFVSPLINISCYIGGHQLSRLDIVHNGFLRMEIMTASGMKRSTGKVGSYCCATIPVEMDDAIASISCLNKVDLTIAQVKSTLGRDDPNICAVLTEYHRNNTPQCNDCVFPVEYSVQRYQFDPKSFDPHAKPSVVAFMNPIINECFAPDKCLNNDQRAVDGRVKEIKNPVMEITPFMNQVMDEFAEIFIPCPHLGIPGEVTEVFERQPRPAQQAILNQAASLEALVEDKPIQTFQKAESYNDVKDPRVISTIPGCQKLHYSRYIYAFSEHLRTMPWYAFGKTPLEIAARVTQICTSASSVVNTDLSRFDGRVSNILRLLENKVMLRYFNVKYHSELVELQQAQRNQRAYTTFGVKYETDETRLSGSAETADMNSVDNAFMAFLANRMTRSNGAYLTPKEAWDKLGIYGGDDGVTPDIDPTTYVKACKLVGQVLEVEVVKKGDSGVSFLSRQFSPHVWWGSPNSCCDIRRQLAKIHVTHTLPPNVTPMDKLGEKLAGYAMTDANTPIIGEIIAVASAHSMLPKSFKLGIAGYYTNYDINNQFPNVNDGDWMSDYVRRTFPKFDHGKFKQWLIGCQANKALLLTPPLCEPNEVAVEVKKDVVVNGDVKRAPAAKRDTKPIGTRDPPRKDKLCGDFQKGTCKRTNCKFKHSLRPPKSGKDEVA